MTGIWTHRFEVVMRPLRDLSAAPTVVYIDTRTAAQAGRDAVTQYPDMKVLTVTRMASDGEPHAGGGPTDMSLALAQVGSRR